MEFVLAFVVLGIVALLVMGGYTLKASGENQGILNHPVTVVGIDAALAKDPVFTKTKAEERLVNWLSQDEAMKNTSREDVRAVLTGIGVMYREINKDGLVAQTRAMQDW